MMLEKIAILGLCLYFALIVGTIIRVLQTQCSLRVEQWIFVMFVPFFLIGIAPIMICNSRKDGFKIGELLETYKIHIRFFPVILKAFVEWACEGNGYTIKTYSRRDGRRKMNFMDASEKMIKNDSIFA